MTMFKDIGDITLYEEAVPRNKLFYNSFKPHFLFCHHSLLLSKFQSLVSFFCVKSIMKDKMKQKQSSPYMRKKILEEIYKGDVITKYATRTMMLCL